MEDFVERWIEITDRGGLVKANEEFYSFVLKTEEVARSFMTVDLLRKNQEENMREILKFKLNTVPEVSATYGFLCLEKCQTGNYQINFLNKLLKSD